MSASRYLPDTGGWIFAMKTFAAAMLALYIALAAGLERPYWAMATVYIVANPLSGAMRSKAVYRLLGTLAGAIATIAIVPNLVNTPELLSAALALWIAGCLYLAMVDRTPRAYAFILAGYTVAIVGFPVVEAPGAVWDIVVSRTEEIAIGVICVTLVSSLIFPSHLGPVLRARIVGWLRDVDRLTVDAIAPDEATPLEARRFGPRLAAEAVGIRAMTTHLSYDTSSLKDAARPVSELQQRMVMILPLIASLRDRLADLRALGGVTEPLDALLTRVRDWIASAAAAQPADAALLRDEIASLQDQADFGAGWEGVLLISVLERLRELVDWRQDCLALYLHVIAGGGRRKMPRSAMDVAGEMTLHRDHGVAALRGAAVVLVIFITCAYWIGTGWADGAQAVMLAAVACCFTALQDDPVPSIWGLLVPVTISALCAAIGQFVILPLATSPEMLVIAAGAFFIPAGLLMEIPATQRFGGALTVFTATLLALQGSYSADFATWANGTAAALFGVAVAAAASALVLPAGVAWSVQRRLRANWADLAAVARGRKPMARSLLAGLFLDRIGLLAPSPAMVTTNGQMTAVAAMTDLRVGINLIDLNALRREMPSELGAAVDDVLREAAEHFAGAVARDAMAPATSSFLQAIDQAIDAANAATTRFKRNIVLGLAGLRCNLFPAAEAYAPSAVAEDTVLVLAYEGDVG